MVAARPGAWRPGCVANALPGRARPAAGLIVARTATWPAGRRSWLNQTPSAIARTWTTSTTARSAGRVTSPRSISPPLHLSGASRDTFLTHATGGYPRSRSIGEIDARSGVGCNHQTSRDRAGQTLLAARLTSNTSGVVVCCSGTACRSRTMDHGWRLGSLRRCAGSASQGGYGHSLGLLARPLRLPSNQALS